MIPAIVILGPRGSGKSTLLGKIARAARAPVLIIDPMHEHAGELLKYPVVAPCTKKWVFRPTSNEDWECLPDIIYAFAKCPGGLTLIADEAPIWAMHDPDTLLDMINYGRHYRISTILTARRPAEAADIMRHATANASTIIVFATREPRDRDFIARYVDSAIDVVNIPRFKVIEIGQPYLETLGLSDYICLDNPT
jgi:hypothetical protein